MARKQHVPSQVPQKKIVLEMVYLPLSVFDHGEGVQEQRFKVNQ